MKRFVIFVMALAVRQIQAETVWQFQGTVVDGLDRPVEETNTGLSLKNGPRFVDAASSPRSSKAKKRGEDAVSTPFRLGCARGK